MSVKRFSPFLLSILFFAVVVQAQEVAPYSQFLLGDMRGVGFTTQTSIGRVTSAFRDPLHINFSNPASYSALKLTTLEGGAVFSSKKIKSDVGTTHAGTGFVDFAALAFPIVKRINVGEKLKEKELNVAGVSLGLIPFSSVKYNFESIDTSVNNVSYKKVFNGSGSIYQLYVGGGIKFPFKNDTAKHTFAIGFNAIYLFGRTRHVEFIDFIDNPNYLGVRKNTTLRNSDIAWNTGIQYILRLQKKWSITLGADAYIPMDVKAKYSDVWDRFRVTSNGVFVQDTAFDSGETIVRRKFPALVGGGFMLSKSSNFKFSADVHYQIWGSNNDLLNSGIVAQNSIRFNVGTEIMPFFKGKSNFLKRTHYRLGAWYETATLNLNSKDITQYGITFGLGLPSRGSFSLLNLGMEFGQRGTIANGLMKETFIRTYIGLTLNDKWFIKRKYD
jgi:hypothetical protein